MGLRPICYFCHKTKFWKLADERLKCRHCRKVFTPKSINSFLLRKIVAEFVLGHSTNIILARIRISKRKLLNILTLLRIAMMKDIPDVFEGVVEVDETYIGGQWKNKRKSDRLKYHPRGRGTLKQPVFGIRCRAGKVYAELVNNAESEVLWPLIEKQVKTGSVICSDTWRGYTGIAAKGYVHRLVDHDKQYSDRRGRHINGLEGFWGYLKRKLAAKGGIRRGRLHIYLGEYVWRYNHRNLSLKEQENLLLKLIKKYT